MFIEANIQSNKTWLLKSVNYTLKSQPNKVWKIFFLPPGKESHLAFSLRLLSLSVYLVEQWMLLQNILSRSKMTLVCVSSASVLRPLNMYLQLQFF
jgi:hypothetical protein